MLFIGIILLTAWGPEAGIAARSQGSGPGGQDRRPALFDAFLYFTGPDGAHLTAETRQFPPTADAHLMGRALLGALMAGPAVPGLTRPFPEGSRINALFITDRGEAYVDLETDMAGRSDTMSEYLAVYSLVNTLSVNIPEIRQVRILVNGKAAESLGGHISLVPFYRTNMLIVK